MCVSGWILCRSRYYYLPVRWNYWSRSSVRIGENILCVSTWIFLPALRNSKKLSYSSWLAVFVPSCGVAKLSLRSEVPPWYLLAPAFPSKILGYINGGLHSEGKWLRLLFLTLELKVDTKSLSIIMGPYVTIYNTWASARVSSISLFLWHFILFMFRKEWERAFRELSYLLILWKKLE